MLLERPAEPAALGLAPPPSAPRNQIRLIGLD